MPVEIRELYIKVTVNQPQGTGQPAPAPGNASTEKDDKETLINQCVEEVMTIINNKKER